MRKLLGIGIMLSSMVVVLACGSKHSDPQKDPEPTVNTPDNSQQSPPNDTVNPPIDNNNPTPDPTGTNPPPPIPETLASCLQVCEGKYPNAAAQNKAFDTNCMLGVCENVCNGIGASGKNYPSDLVADGGGPVCDTAAANSWVLETPSIFCSNCLASTPACCAAWTQIFGSVEGQGLAICAGSCYTKYSK